MTDITTKAVTDITPGAVAKMLDRLTFETVNSEINRALASELGAMIKALSAKMAEVTASERELSASYLRIRSLTKAFATNFGGENRFAVTEKAVSDLVARAEAAEAIRADMEGK